MRADIAIAEAAKNGVGQGMQHGISVRMADQRLIMGDLHPAEPDMITGAEGMHVVASCGAALQHLFDDLLGPLDVSVDGQFESIRFSGEAADLLTAPFDEASIISEVKPPGLACSTVRVKKRREFESLRRLHDAHRRAVHGACKPAIGSDLVDGVDNGQQRHGRAEFLGRSMARVTRSQDMNGRAASCTSTTSGLLSARASMPSETEACLVAPPKADARRPLSSASANSGLRRGRRRGHPDESR